MHLRLRTIWAFLFFLFCFGIIHLFNFYRPLNIELKLRTNKSTVLRINYSVNKYQPKKVLRFPVKSSWRKMRTAKFKLPAQEIHKIKIFPGHYKRKISIHSICFFISKKKTCWNAKNFELNFNSYLNSKFQLNSKRTQLFIDSNGKNSAMECKIPFSALHKKMAFQHSLYYGLLFLSLTLSSLLFFALKKHLFHKIFVLLHQKIVSFIKRMGTEHFFILKFFILLGLLELYVYFSVFQFTDGSEGLANFSNGFGVLDIFFLEFLLMALAAIWMVSHRKILRRIFYFILAFFILIHCIQFLSVYFSNDFLTLDALLNVKNISLMLNFFNLSVLLAPPLSLTFLFAFIVKKIRPIPLAWWKKGVFSFLIFLIAVLSYSYRHFNTERKKNIHNLEKRLTIGHSAPLLSMTKLFREAVFGNTKKRKNIQLSSYDLKIARKFGFTIQADRYYPLKKDWISKKKFPYPVKKIIKKPNIILFLVESLSARKIGIYGSPYKKITPNIDNFAKSSTVIYNYYNHVSPTIRGIKGQLCSLFPSFGYRDWLNSRIRTGKVLGLPHILNQMGYSTVYLNHDAPDVTYLEEQIKQFGFNETYFDEKILKELLPGEKNNTWGLSDHQMVRALIALIKKQNSKNPFFMALSTIETHTGMNVFSQDGIKYPYKNNNVLNTTYNFDHAFGLFWKFFKNSHLFKNTIVILTADHAHYPSRNFIRIAGKKYKKYYSDQIALIIYHPGYHLPSRINIPSTSLDFAPTVLHMLKVFKKPNAFLGLSLFGERKSIKNNLATYRKSLYLINKKTIRAYRMNKKYRSKKLKSLIKILRYFQQVERQNRIWK